MAWAPGSPRYVLDYSILRSHTLFAFKKCIIAPSASLVPTRTLSLSPLKSSFRGQKYHFKP
jgi:hypothetical protein